MPFGPEPTRPIGPPQRFGSVVQFGCRDGAAIGREPGRPCAADGDAVVGRGEADPVELAVDLGQEIGSTEGGPTFGHPFDGDTGRRPTESRRRGHPCAVVAGRCGPPVRRPMRSVRRRCRLRRVGASPLSSRPGCDALWPGGSQAWPGAAARGTCAVVGWRPWAATNSPKSAVLRSSMAVERWENSAIRASETPVTSKRSRSEWRGFSRPSPSPTSRSRDH